MNKRGRTASTCRGQHIAHQLHHVLVGEQFLLIIVFLAGEEVSHRHGRTALEGQPSYTQGKCVLHALLDLTRSALGKEAGESGHSQQALDWTPCLERRGATGCWLGRVGRDVHNIEQEGGAGASGSHRIR